MIVWQYRLFTEVQDLNIPKVYTLIEQPFDGGCCYYSPSNVCVYSDCNSYTALEDLGFKNEIIAPECLYSTATLVFPNSVDYYIEEIPIYED